MKYITSPWSHQKKDVDKIHKEHIQYYALFYDMGAGKTKAAIDISRSIYLRNDSLVKTLIICPIAVVSQWAEEYSVHSKVPPVAIQILDGMTKLNGKKLKTAQLKIKLEQLNNNKASIFIINTESVGNRNLWPLLLEMGFELLIVDESHRFKGYNAVRTKALHELTLQPTLKYRYILTGSPVLQDAGDLWSQFFILNPDILGRNFFTFRNKYFYDSNAGMPANVHFPNWIPKDANYYRKLKIPYEDVNDTLNKIIYNHATRVMKDDVLDLPPYISQTVDIEMGKEQARIYKEMRDDLVATLEEGTLENIADFDTVTDLDDSEVMSADLAIVKTLRLMQITAGIFTNEDGEVTTLKSNLEAELKEMLLEICANKENKVIVWSIFKPTYNVIAKLCEDLNLKYVFYNGLQDKAEKDAAKKQFNEDPATQVIIANQAAGGTGLNLTSANYDIYYSWDFSLEKHLQSAARAYRGGQKRKYTSYKLVTKDTVAERSLTALEEKAANAEDILKVKKEFSRSEILGLI